MNENWFTILTMSGLDGSKAELKELAESLQLAAERRGAEKRGA